jgi:hypothetical protein
MPLTPMSPAQQRLYDAVARHEGIQYWDAANDWVAGSGRAASLAFRNITRTVNAMIRDGHIRLDEDGYLWIQRETVS